MKKRILAFLVSFSNLALPLSGAAVILASPLVILTASAQQAPELTALEKFLHESAAAMKITTGYYKFDNNYEVKVRKVSRVNNESHMMFRPEFLQENIAVEFTYDDIALKNPQSLLTEFAAFVVFAKHRSLWNAENGPVTTSAEGMNYTSPINKTTLAELLSNVNAGSPSAKARLNLLKVKALKTLSINAISAQNFGVSETVFLDAANELQSKQASLDSTARAYLRSGQKSIDAWRSQTGALAALETQELKLNDLVLNNDRAGVRRMLEAYLPWAVMEPAETKAWKNWLEAIEHPDKTNTTVAFRGVDFSTDFVQTKKTATGNKYGFFSTVLTQNQGSYTRRLRSLSTNRIKNGDYILTYNPAFVPQISMTSQFLTHAGEARASNFLSFSYSPSIARAFSRGSIEQEVNGKMVTIPRGGLLAVQMDSRRLFPNILGLSGEIELLVPLIIFPDEVLEYREGFLQPAEFNEFVAKISKKTGIDFPTDNKVSPELKARYNREAFQFMANITDLGASVKSCGGIFL